MADLAFDVVADPETLASAGRLAKAAERNGYDACWIQETRRDPFPFVAASIMHTRSITLGTAVALAFPRSPMTLAYTAWDLQKSSGGRFVLGLGSQVRRHIEGRFGVSWESPEPKMREVIQALRAIWKCWQTGGPLAYEGQFFKLDLMTPFFNPGPIEHPDIPIFLAAVNSRMARLAGELCQGVHIHPLHTARYLRETVIRNVRRGAIKAGRPIEDIQLCACVIVATGCDASELKSAREEARALVAFYASTPAYRPVLAAHGLEQTSRKLAACARRGEWSALAGHIPDQLLDEVAVCAPLDEVSAALISRYRGLATRIYPYMPFTGPTNSGLWGRLNRTRRGPTSK